MANIYKVTLRESRPYVEEGIIDIPTAEVIVTNPEGESKVIGYLSPFRKYKFQISMTFEGQICLGDTPVISDLSDQIGLMRDDVAELFIQGQIMWAIADYTNTTYGRDAANGGAMSILPGFEGHKMLNKIARIFLDYFRACNKKEVS